MVKKHAHWMSGPHIQESHTTLYTKRVSTLVLETFTRAGDKILGRSMVATALLNWGPINLQRNVQTG